MATELSPFETSAEVFQRVVTEGRIQAGVLRDVLTERFKQDQKWGSQRRLPNLYWNAILGEEVGEATKEVLENNDDLLREELVQVAAVAVAWIEALDGKEEEDSVDGQATGLHS